MSRFETMVAGLTKHEAAIFGESMTFTHSDQTTTTVTVTMVEDVGATDPFIERTFSIAEADFTGTALLNGDVGELDGGRWVVIKIRDNGDGYLEVRTRAVEEVV